MNTKKCYVCNKIFPTTSDYFFKTPKTKDGLLNKCKECSKQYSVLRNKIARVGADNKKKCVLCHEIKPIEDFESNKNAACKECLKTKKCCKCGNVYERTKENFPRMTQCRKCTNESIRNSENHKIRKKKYYEKHKEDICLKGKTYRENKRKNGTFVEGKRDSIKKRCSSQRRKARKHGLTAIFNHFEWDECKQFFNFQCAYCGKEDSLAQDHFIPLAKGGGYEKSNIVPACMICNSYKRDLDFLEWYPQQEFYSEERKEKIFKYLGF